MYVLMLEYENECKLIEMDAAADVNDAIMWARFYMYTPGVQVAWVTDYTWGRTYYECGVCSGL